MSADCFVDLNFDQIEIVMHCCWSADLQRVGWPAESDRNLQILKTAKLQSLLISHQSPKTVPGRLKMVSLQNLD